MIDITSPRPRGARASRTASSSKAAATPPSAAATRSPGLSDRGEFALTLARLSDRRLLRRRGGGRQHRGRRLRHHPPLGQRHLLRHRPDVTLRLGLLAERGRRLRRHRLRYRSADRRPEHLRRRELGPARRRRLHDARRPAREHARARAISTSTSTQDSGGPDLRRRPPSTPRAPATRAEYIGDFAPSDALALQFGADYAYETSESQFEPTLRTATGRDSNWIAGAFVQADWSPVDRADPQRRAALRRALRVRRLPHRPPDRRLRPRRPTPCCAARSAPASAPPSNFELFDRPPLRRATPTSSPRPAQRRPRRRAALRRRPRPASRATLFWLEIDDLIEFDRRDPRASPGRRQRRRARAWSSPPPGRSTDAADADRRLHLHRRRGGRRRAPRPRAAPRPARSRVDGAVTDRISLGLGAHVHRRLRRQHRSRPDTGRLRRGLSSW